jgi:hypothetical protein
MADGSKSTQPFISGPRPTTSRCSLARKDSRARGVHRIAGSSLLGSRATWLRDGGIGAYVGLGPAKKHVGCTDREGHADSHGPDSHKPNPAGIPNRIRMSDLIRLQPEQLTIPTTERDALHAFSRLSARTIGSPLERAGHPEADPALPARVGRSDHVAISRTADRRIV